MIKYLHHLNSKNDPIFEGYAVTRGASVLWRHELFSTSIVEKMNRAISFRPGWLDFFTSPLKTMFTLIAREKYNEAIKKGATSSEFEISFENLVKACAKQQYGIKVNFESVLLIFKIEDQLKSLKEVRKTLADSRVYSDKHGAMIFSEHHHLVNSVAKIGAIALATVGIGFLVAFLYEFILSNCVRTCSVLGAIEVFSFIAIFFKACFSVGYRKPNLDLLVEILYSPQTNS